jgi:transcriptional regulator with XRE-family HTH domain
MACRLLHRTSLGLSQKASVREVGVDLSTLARWERDEKKPTGMDLIRVERFLADAAASNTPLRRAGYRTLENVIEGAVITFTEISIMKKAQAALRDSEALRRLAVVVRDARDAILVQDMTVAFWPGTPERKRCTVGAKPRRWP